MVCQPIAPEAGRLRDRFISFIDEFIGLRYGGAVKNVFAPMLISTALLFIDNFVGCVTILLT